MISNPVNYVSNFIRQSTMNKENFTYVTGLLEAFYLSDSISFVDYVDLVFSANRFYLEFIFDSEE